MQALMTATMHKVGTFETSLKVVTVRSDGQQWEIDVDAKQRYGLPGCGLASASDGVIDWTSVDTTEATLLAKIQELQTKLSAIEAEAKAQLTYIHATGEAVVSAGGVKIGFGKIRLIAADTPTTKRLGTAGFDNVKQAERFIFDHLGFVPDIEGKSHYGIWDDSRHSDGERYGPPNQQVRLTTAQAAHAAANGGIVIKAHRNKLGKLTYRDTDTVRNNDGFDHNWRQDNWN